MRLPIIFGVLNFGSQAKQNISVCDTGSPSGKCAPKEPFCPQGYSCENGECCPAKLTCTNHYCYIEDKYHVCSNKIPIESVAPNACSTPGYTTDPLIGCYKVAYYPTAIPYDEGKQGCEKDGGRLLLINSAEEGQKLLEAIRSEMIISAVIQGSRYPDSSYIDDKGNPLPYLPSMIENKDDEAKTKLMLTYAPPDQIKFMFSAISQGEKYKYFACEFKSINCSYADKSN